jgi:anti-anti-sigma regulatory factor
MTADTITAPPAEDLADDLSISTDLQAGRVAVTGDLERISAHHLLDAVRGLALSDQRIWSVDAGGITFCDVEGLRVLARARSLAESHGRTLELAHARPFLTRLLLLSGYPHGH